MPARYLKVVSFEGLERHVFEDDRKTNRGPHPFSDMRYQGVAAFSGRLDPRRVPEHSRRLPSRARREAISAGPREFVALRAIGSANSK